jgi:hypothetical protein
MKIRSVGAKVFRADRRTDGWTEIMKLITTFCNLGTPLIEVV